MKQLFSLLLIFLFVTGRSQSKDESEIRAILAKQVTSWNLGDIHSFMQGYWKSDSMMFIGKSGVTYGYENTLARYIKSYSDTAAMGKLSFELIHVKRLSVMYFYVVGKWHLERSIGNVGGHYTLLFRKIKGTWYIVADHSS